MIQSVLFAALALLTLFPEWSFASKEVPMRDFAMRNFGDLKRFAEALAKSEYQPSPALPQGIDNLSYDDYRMIAFRHEQAIGFNTTKPFWFEMFHRGFVHRDKVNLNLISGNRDVPIPFDPAVFQYRGPLAGLELPAETGYAGLRVVGSFPGRKNKQEMLTFVGASYFRALANGGVYGASTRGLAIDIGTEGAEEFPVFREFWIQDPQKGDTSLKLLALLDGPSVCGAYEFTFQPGADQTNIDINATLYWRKKPQKVGLAPLTSMWMWGDGIAPPPKDSRPEVHDSDGLLIETNDKWVYRALSRQSYPSLSRFDFSGVNGFGLLQRETNYKRYQDDEANYHLRPSIWIKPQTPFQNGHIELLELPGVHEGIDNIAAYWVPENMGDIGKPVELAYRVSYFSGDLPEHAWLGRALETKVDRRKDNTLEFQVSFEGKALTELAPDTPLVADIKAIRGRVVEHKILEQAEGGRVLQIVIQPEGNGPVEVEACLMDSNRGITETWSYLCALTVPSYKFPQVYTRME
jgi:glucans biosynthesis protein